MFDHYLITRYNVPVENWKFDKWRVNIGDAQWLQHRFDLFIAYCLPSVRAQTNQDFTWLIYMDRQTPLFFVDQAKQAITPNSNFEIRLVKDELECMEDILSRLGSSKSPYVISSRLDNDDALGIGYVETVQANFAAQSKLLINLLGGYGYNVEKQVLTRLPFMEKNHFTSLIEKLKDNQRLLTIRGFDHDDPPADIGIKNISIPFGWLKLFHQRNLKSRPFGTPHWSEKPYIQYGLTAEHLRINYMNTIAYAAWWLKDGISRKIFNRKRTLIRNQ